MMRWHPVKVMIDLGDKGDAVFDAYTRGNSWNGWTIPFFTAEEDKRIVDWTHEMAKQSPEGIETVIWNEERQVFVLEDLQYPHTPAKPIPEEDVLAGVSIEELGLTLSGIGSYKWTWETVATSSVV